MLFVEGHQPSNQLCRGTPTGTHCQCSSIASPTLEEQWRSLASRSHQEGQKSHMSQTCRPPSLLCKPFLCPGLAATLRLTTLVDASTSVGTGTKLCTFWFQRLQTTQIGWITQIYVLLFHKFKLLHRRFLFQVSCPCVSFCLPTAPLLLHSL